MHAQIAVQLYVFGEPARHPAEPMEEVLATVERAGYKNIQGWLDFYESEESASKLDSLLAKHGLAMPAAYTGGAMHTDEQASHDIETILLHAKLAAAHGLRIVVLNPDPLSREKTDEELAIQAKNLDRLGEALRTLGIQLAIHQHSPEMRSNAREWYHILHNTNPEKVFFCLDLHWVYRGKQDPYKLLEDAGNRVVDLHLRNSHEGAWAEDLGEGDIDYTRVKKSLGKIGYQGFLTVELAYEDETKITRSLEENLKRSRAFVEEVIAPGTDHQSAH
jgi:inosose dehydratase